MPLFLTDLLGSSFQGTQGLQGISGEFAGQGTQGLQGPYGTSQWTPILSNITMINGNTFKKTSGTSGFDGSVYSAEGFDNAYVSAKASQTTAGIVIGLNSDPSTDSNYTSIDYCWRLDSSGNLTIYENGTIIGSFGSYSIGTYISIVYDGTEVKYYVDGVLKRSVLRSPLSLLYLDTAFSNVGGQIESLVFGQGGAGLQGRQGLQGNQGLQGLSNQGTQGLQGLQGNQGVQGNQGLQGNQGNQGTQGLQGLQGDQGTQGNQGTQGLQGLQGNQGLSNQGVQGGLSSQGLQGLQGNQGIQGLSNQGTQGLSNQGSQGLQGDQGIQGNQGLSNQGTQGNQGFQGLQGLQGMLSSQGLQGLQGPSGSSVASSLSGGIASQIPYQSAESTTSFIANGTSGQFLKSNGTSAPSWVDPVIPSGTRMLFHQSAAPTGWTKDTTNNNNSALRVVTGNISTGGNLDFTSAFANRSLSGSWSGSVSGSNSGGSVSDHTLSVSEMPSHSHTLNGKNDPAGDGGGVEWNEIFDLGRGSGVNNTGGSGSHGHGFNNPSWSGSVSGNVSMSDLDIRVKYTDIIIAQKD